jgi:hypothetical protein
MFTADRTENRGLVDPLRQAGSNDTAKIASSNGIYRNFVQYAPVPDNGPYGGYGAGKPARVQAGDFFTFIDHAENIQFRQFGCLKIHLYTIALDLREGIGSFPGNNYNRRFQILPKGPGLFIQPGKFLFHPEIMDKAHEQA